MPIYEYRCKSCDHDFQLLVRGETTPQCESCGSEDLEKLLSLPRVHSEGTRAKGLRAAKKREAARAKDRMHEQLKYEESHDRHG